MIICIDIGGTKTRVALSKDLKTFIYKDSFSTSQNPQETILAILDSIKKSGYVVFDKIVVGVPGIIEDGVIESSPNLPEWNNFNFCSALKEKINTDVIVINDALLGALGEAVYGAGKDYKRVGFITVSTGVGGALIVDKKIDSQGLHFEPGRIVIDIESGKTLQDYVSGAGVFKETGKKPKEITDPEFWDKKAEILALGLINIIDLWSPDILVIGGPMVLGNPRIDLQKTISYIQKCAGELSIPHIVPAEIGDETGLRGGLCL